MATRHFAAKRLTERNEVLNSLVASKQLMIVGGMADVPTGRVTLLT